MKKILSIVIVSALLLGLAGCNKTQTDENGNEYSIDGTTYTVYPKEFPYDIDYNGENLVLEDILLYQYDERSGSSTYNLYIIAEFDTSGLNDQNKFWLSSDLTGELRITSEDNDMADAYGRTLGNTGVEDTDMVVFVFSPLSNVNRHSFVGADITLTLSLDEEEGDYNDIEIVYSETVPEDIPSSDMISTKFSSDLYLTIIGWEI